MSKISISYRILGLLLGLAAVATGCGGTSEAGAGGRLTLVAYSTPREIYSELTKNFAKTEAGRGVSFDESYGSSGEQSRAVESGLPADVVAFSLAPDIDRLVKAGLVDQSWATALEHDGFVSTS